MPVPGCTAEALLKVDPTVASMISKCMLGVKIYQTDFDGDEGTEEQLEFLRVDGLDVKGNMAPGKNPCRAAWKGTPLSLASLEHSVLSGHDVTVNASQGEVAVQAKITDHVDECAHDGYLLDGLVQMNCSLTPPLENNETESADGQEANVTRPLTLLFSSDGNGQVAVASTRRSALLEVPPAVGRPSAKQPLHYEAPMAHPTAAGHLTEALRRRASFYRMLSS